MATATKDIAIDPTVVGQPELSPAEKLAERIKSERDAGYDGSLLLETLVAMGGTQGFTRNTGKGKAKITLNRVPLILTVEDAESAAVSDGIRVNLDRTDGKLGDGKCPAKGSFDGEHAGTVIRAYA